MAGWRQLAMNRKMKAIQTTATTSDEELLRRMMAGEASAFEQLYDRRQAGIYHFALRMTGSSVLAEDVVQDVFMEFMRDARLFDSSKGTVAGYLMGMARHRILRRLERERRFVSIAEPDEREHELPGKTDEGFVVERNPYGDFELRETVETVRQAILSLPEHYREVVVLCSLHEMSYEQAADVVGCPVGTVRSRLNRARAMLVDKLQLLRATYAAPVQLASVGNEL
ncbi:MAG: RNA polymerase sigma factor [Acidobacteria bacterium]|nr:RNA polymerase sigma factor [Acidobacteriota bacterium]